MLIKQIFGMVMNWLKKIFAKHENHQERDPEQSNAYDLIGGDKVIRAIAHEFYQQMQQRPQETETIVRETPKINRNDNVTIKHVMSGKTETIKYKKAESMIASGEWVLVNE